MIHSGFLDMLIFDGDYPMAYGALDLDRDLTLPLSQLRADERESEHRKWPHAGTMASLPECRAAGMAAALVKIVGRIRRPDSPIWGYSSAENAYAAAQAALAYYRILDARQEGRIITTAQQLTDQIATNVDSVVDYQQLADVLRRRG
jgi:membrane dipeptidase